MQKPELLNRNDAADYISVKPQTLSVWATTGRYSLPFVKVGRKVLPKVTMKNYLKILILW